MNETVLTQMAISVSILAILWFWAFASIRRDNFRSDIRRLRDGLFDYMWENGHSFDTAAYQETRLMLNGMLRLSNSMSAIKFFGFVVLHRHHRDREVGDLLARMPNGELKKEIERVRIHAVARLLHFLFLEGTTGLAIRGVLFTAKVVKRANVVKSWATNQGNRLLEDFRVFGEPGLSRNSRSLLQCE